MSRRELSLQKMLLLNEKIHRIQEARSDLLHQLAVLDSSLRDAQSEYDSLCNLVAPVSILPEEILSVIFEECYNMQKPVTSPRIEMTIAQVTKYWRAVALSTPRIWKTLYISPRTHYDHANAYLQRSKLQNLDLHLEFSIYLQDESAMAPSFNVYALVAQASERWKNITIKMVGDGSLELLFVHLPSTTPILESLSIIAGDDHTGVDDAPLRALFTRGAPLLKHVTSVGFGLYLCPPPLSGITHLLLYKVCPVFWTNYEEICAMLYGLNSLTYLSVLGDIFNVGLPSTSVSVLLPSLRTLIIGQFQNGSVDFDILVTTISAPVLELLILTDISQTNIHVPMIKNSFPLFPSLRSLVVKMRTSFISYSWVDFGQAFPTVTHLTILNEDPETHLYLSAALDLNQGTELLWPRLQTIYLASGAESIVGSHGTFRASRNPIQIIHLDPGYVQEELTELYFPVS